MKYKLYTYDLWGNKKDGYEINDLYPSNISLDIGPDDSDEIIIKKVRKEMIKKPHTKSFTIYGDYADRIYVELRGVPLYELRPVANG